MRDDDELMSARAPPAVVSDGAPWGSHGGGLAQPWRWYRGLPAARRLTARPFWLHLPMFCCAAMHLQDGLPIGYTCEKRVTHVKLLGAQGTFFSFRCISATEKAALVDGPAALGDEVDDTSRCLQRREEPGDKAVRPNSLYPYTCSLLLCPGRLTYTASSITASIASSASMSASLLHYC